MQSWSHFNDLIELYKIPTHTSSNDIKKKIVSMIPDYEWRTDEAGNLYGSHPKSTSRVALSAHLDMVKTGKDIKYVVNTNGILFGIDESFRPTSLGADDKNGLWCIIKASQHKSKPHIVLFEKEEVGRVGSQACNKSWFNDKDYCIVIDRKGDKEIIVEGFRGQYTHLLGPMFKQVNPEWKFEKGLSCDADSIRDSIDVINISCGYYNAHTKDEYTVLEELEETLNAVTRMLDADLTYLPWQAIKEIHRHKFYEQPKTCNKCATGQQDIFVDEMGFNGLTFEEWSKMHGAV